MNLTSINGRLLDGINIGLTPRDRGFLLGDGVFETLLCCNHVALWRNEHVERMRHSAEACGVVFPVGSIAESVDELLRHSSAGPHVMRISLSRGPGVRGLAADSKETTLVITCDPIDTLLVGKPLQLSMGGACRNGNAFSDRHKTLSYMNNVVAARTAQVAGCEDALLLSTDGQVACTTIANVFMLKDGHLVTPRLEDGVLNGIMRQQIIKNHGTEVREITVSELMQADAVFISNSLRLIRPVVSLDGRALKQQPAAKFLNPLLDYVQHSCGMQLMKHHA